MVNRSVTTRKGSLKKMDNSTGEREPNVPGVSSDLTALRGLTKRAGSPGKSTLKVLGYPMPTAV
jgi:hypothetical protein